MLFGYVYEDGTINNGALNFPQAVLISLVAILLVFIILLIVIGCVDLLHLCFKNKAVEVTKPVKTVAKKASNTITDDDMMVAALIATIDYRQEVKKDVKLVSIKRIK